MPQTIFCTYANLGFVHCCMVISAHTFYYLYYEILKFELGVKETFSK